MLKMEYGKKYQIQRVNKEMVEGEYVQTRGDDENWPTFVLADGSRIGVYRSEVLGPVVDDCPPKGIERSQ